MDKLSGGHSEGQHTLPKHVLAFYTHSTHWGTGALELEALQHWGLYSRRFGV